MKKSGFDENEKIEQLLKTKMNKLSSSVDCFDKIASRAFQEESQDFSESELTVTELENVTGRRRRLPVLRWAAAMAAFVLIIGIVPQTAFFRSVMSNIGHKEGKKKYVGIISELDKELELFDYETIDVPLDEYIANDLFYTPMLGCPFGANSGDDDEELMVRVFIKKIGDYFTNQAYAVEYIGKFNEKNYIAAASTGVQITMDDIKSAADKAYFMNRERFCYLTARNNFISDAEKGLTDSLNNSVSVAAFDYFVFYKENDTITPLTCSFMYSHRNEKLPFEYSYDVSAYSVGSSGSVEYYPIVLPEDAWKTSVYYNGISAEKGKNDGTNIKHTKYFEEGFEGKDDIFYIRLSDMNVSDSVFMRYMEFGDGSEAFSKLMLPSDKQMLSTLRVYITGTVGDIIFNDGVTGKVYLSPDDEQVQFVCEVAVINGKATSKDTIIKVSEQLKYKDIEQQKNNSQLA